MHASASTSPRSPRTPRRRSTASSPKDEAADRLLLRLSDGQPPADAATRTVPEIEDGQIEAAQLQASWFSPVCRVFAPMYRQVTATATRPVAEGDREWQYADVRAAWRRLPRAATTAAAASCCIGHSQGDVHAQAADPGGDRARPELAAAARLRDAARRRRRRAERLGDRRRLPAHVPACTTARQVGCVVAFSAWDKAAARERVLPERRRTRRAQHILCVNPAAPGGGAAPRSRRSS